MSDDLKKSVSSIKVATVVLKAHKIFPLLAWAFNKSPAELSVNKSPCFEIAKAKKCWVLINEEIDRMSQIISPCFISKHINLLSWLIK